MNLTITLTDIEVAALASEQLTAQETLESVLRRQIIPLTERLLAGRFDTLLTGFKTLDTADKADILATLETIAATRKKN